MTVPADIVVPVFRGLEQTRRCLESVLAHRDPAAEIVVVDDASPEPELSGYVGALERAGHVTLLRNGENSGFVRSVNRAMSLHPDRDVILLNSDTEVANDWARRLRAAAYSAPDIASVTPFSNNATICSYPFEGWEGGVPGSLGLAALDQLAARANAGKTLDLPTAVGFCMYVRREALRRFGLFDAERYGQGYGEENDFSRRAAKGGWRNVLAGDVFVYHEGSVSFTGERSERVRAATAALLQVHPEYTAVVRDFIRADPACGLRGSIDAARIAHGAAEARHVLDERAAERARLAARLERAEREAADRSAHAAEVHEALARVTELAHQRLAQIEQAERAREAALAELGGEIEHLRRSLADMEASRAAVQAELERIQSMWTVRAHRRLSNLLRRGTPAGERTEP